MNRTQGLLEEWCFAWRSGAVTLLIGCRGSWFLHRVFIWALIGFFLIINQYMAFCLRGTVVVILFSFPGSGSVSARAPAYSWRVLSRLSTSAPGVSSHLKRLGLKHMSLNLVDDSGCVFRWSYSGGSGWFLESWGYWSQGFNELIVTYSQITIDIKSTNDGSSFLRLDLVTHPLQVSLHRTFV